MLPVFSVMSDDQELKIMILNITETYLPICKALQYKDLSQVIRVILGEI